MNLDVDQFIKDMESIMKHQGGEDDNSDVEEGSSSDMDFSKIFVLIFTTLEILFIIETNDIYRQREFIHKRLSFLAMSLTCVAFSLP